MAYFLGFFMKNLGVSPEVEIAPLFMEAISTSGVGLSPLALFCSYLTKKELKQWLNPSRNGRKKMASICCVRPLWGRIHDQNDFSTNTRSLSLKL
jgi:hypothetical protein